MKHSILIFLALFAVKTQAQQQLSPEVRAKMKQMQAKIQNMQQPKDKIGGKITYTVNGKTYTVTKEVSTVIIDGKIGDISDNQLNIVIGDGTAHPFKIGEPYICNGLIAKIDGLQYARGSKDNKVTILSYNGKVIKGIFSGTIYNEKTKKTLPIKGSFETGNITSL